MKNKNNNNLNKQKSGREQRAEPRIHLNEALELYNSHTGKKVGQMVNLSENGFMLSSQEPVPEGLILQCQVTIEKEDRDGSIIHIGAESLWQKEGASSSQYWNGFRILDISDEDQQKVLELLEI